MASMEIDKNNRVSRQVVLGIATASAFLTPFMASAVNIALPSIGTEFSLDAVSLSWVATSYLLAAAVFLVPLGRIADMYGRKRVFQFGILLYTVSSLVLTYSNSFVMLIAFRVVQGAGAAMVFANGVAILTSVFPPGERGRVLGINVAAVYLGLSLGPFLGGLLTDHFGWRSVFLVNVPLGLIVIGGIFWKLRGEWAEARGERFDLTGSVIYGLAMVALIYGLSLLPALPAVWVILAGVVGIALFIRWEMRVESPVMNIGLFRNNAVFTFSNLAALINYSATFAVSFLLSLYLQYIKGFNPESAGVVLVSMPAMQAVFSPIAGRISDRVEPRIVASAGMGLTTVGLALLCLLQPTTSIQFILASLLVLGFGFGLFSSPNTNAVMSSVEKKYYGVASGVLGTMRLTGQMLSMAIAMLIFALFIGRVEITPEYYPAFVAGLRVAFIIFAALCFAGIFASIARGKVRSREVNTV